MFVDTPLSSLTGEDCHIIMEQEPKQRGLTFFSLTNERVVDLLSYAKYLYYIGIIETILYSLSIVGLPLIGFTIMATSFNQNPSIDRVEIVRFPFASDVVPALALSDHRNHGRCDLHSLTLHQLAQVYDLQRRQKRHRTVEHLLQAPRGSLRPLLQSSGHRDHRGTDGHMLSN